jgi:hypothetical protein
LSKFHGLLTNSGLELAFFPARKTLPLRPFGGTAFETEKFGRLSETLSKVFRLTTSNTLLPNIIFHPQANA